MRRFVLILLLGFLGSLSQAQVNNTKYKSGAGDGYDGSRSESFVWEIFQPEAICVGENALFTMQLEGSLLYSYRWYKIGAKTTTLSTESFLFIEDCKIDWDGWQYMCEITDLNTGQTFQPEDTFQLNILTKPIAKINNTKPDTTICYGQQLKLRVTPNGDYTYTWFGSGIVGETYNSQITVKPEEDTRYEVTVSNGVCVSDPVAVQVRVKRVDVKLPQDVVYTISGAVKLKPSQGEGGTLDWYVNGSKYANQEEFSWNMPVDQAETTVKVTRTINNCSVSDSAIILNELAMRRFVGGDNDGFIESMQKVSVSGITPVLSEVCRGEDAYFACNVGTIGTYTYQWYRLDNDGNGIKMSGATNNLLVLETNEMEVAGKYYCVVYDLDTKQSYTTDPATLSVIERPEIEIVTPDTAICEGGQIVLSASRGSEEGETFRWNGLNIRTNPTYQDITVAPTEEATYQLVAMKGTCLTTKEVKVKVNKVQLHLPGVIDILLGDKVVMSQPVEENVRYTWTVNGEKKVGATLEFTPEQNTKVYLEKRIGECKVADSTWVYLKEYGVGLTNEAPQDGYAESVLPFYIISLDCPKRLCAGDEAILNIEVAGYDVYQYVWKRRNPDGTVVVIDSVKQHVMPKVTKDSAGIYFCEVKDMHSGDILISDEVEMEVLARPIAGITFVEPALGDKESCWICAGTSLVLQADQANGLTYQWEGLGILGTTDKPTITALPEETTDYSLVVSNGICSDMAFVKVNIQDISVNIPEVKFVAEGESFTIAPDPAVSEDAKLKWVYRNGASVEAAKYVSSGITESGYLKVTMSLDGCEAHDSTRIYVRKYNTFQGGAEDGFVESNSSFMIQELNYPPIICENDDADFSIRVKGSGIYAYNWKQVGLSATLSTESVYSLQNCELAMNGQQYYCLVTDLMLGKTLSSDTIALNIRKGPEAIINYPERGKAYCIGTTIRLDARQTENSKESPDIEYVYSWEGEHVTETEYPYAVDVTPTATQVYTLKVSTETCSSYDTIQINIIDPRVSIPSVIYAEENTPLFIEAEVDNVSVDATINWWHNALFTPNKNPYEITDITESANVIAEVIDRGCSAYDTARVYVRTNRFFAGGDDDGFMESCNIPEINPDVTTVLGCGGIDSVEMDVLYSGDPKTFVWQRYDKDQGKFVNVAEAEGLFGLGTPKLKIKPLTAAFYGQYRCVLTNDCGSAYSLTYKVSNGNAPEVAAHIDTMTKCEGIKDLQLVMALKEDATIGDITYRWYKKNPVTGVVAQFTPEASFNKNVYIIPEVTPEYDALYLKEAEGVCGTVWDSVRLIVNRKVSFRVQPKDTLVCYNTNVPLHAYSQNGGICSYTLKKVIPDKSTFVGYKVEKICKGNGGNRYDFKPISMNDDGYYVWTVKSECGDSVTSRMFKVTVDKPLQFVSQTVDTTVCLGTSLTLDVQAVSPDCPDSKITYAWEKLSDGKLPYQTASINLTVGANTAGSYLCSATNVCGTIELIDPIEVTVHPELVITQNPVWTNAGVCEENDVELMFAVNYSSIVDSVRWYRKVGAENVLVQNEADRISGADDYSLKIASIHLDEAGSYFARVYNVCGVYETVSVQIEVYENAKVIQPIEAFFDKTTVCWGEEADLKITAAGKDKLIYMWEKNNSTISGAEDNVLHVQFDEDAVYRCIVYNQCAQAYSEWAVSVVQPDTFRFKEVDVTHYCEGENGVRLQLAGSNPKCTYSLYRKESLEANAELVQEIKGEDAPFAGGSLDFGLKPAGIYYVMAYDPDINCDGRMPGEVTVIMDSLPKVFNTVIGYPICEGSGTGNIVLDGSQFALSQRYQYKLMRQDNSGGWNQFDKIVYGTGEALTWDNVQSGIYRIEAIDRQTKCAAVMNGIADLSEHPNPVTCELLQSKGDTAYCDGQKIDVALKMHVLCFTEGQTYTLIKNGEVTDEVRTDNSGWEKLTEGKYSVLIKNEWGCADTSNEIRIHNHPLPAKKDVKQNRFFCDGEVAEGETAIITVSSVDPNTKYSFYRMGESTPFEEVYKNTASFVNTEVSLVNANYYVIATDTATGCSAPMNDTVKIQGSQLELSYTPITMDRSENPVRLNLTVKNAIGKIKVKWEPEEQIQDMTDPLRPWVDMTDLSKNTFTVTVSDTVCTKTETIVVSLEGQALTANIKDPATGAAVPKDTLWVCEGATYSLDGEVLGGKKPWSYEWNLDGTYLSNAKKLTNAVAVKSGNIVFRVGSNGRVASDTVRLELYPAPGKGLQVNAPELCVASGDNFSMELTNTVNGVTYSLEYSKNGDVFKDLGITAVGDATGIASLQESFTEDKAGYYRVKAMLEYDGTACQSLHDTVKVGAGVYKSNFHGGGMYCDRNGLDSLVLDSTVVGVTYRVVYKASAGDEFVRYDKAGVTSGNGDSLFLVGNWPTGIYRMIAQRNGGACVDTMPGEVVIKHLEKPNPGILISDEMEYCVSDDNSLKVTIALSGAVSDNIYKLYRQNGSSVEMLGSPVIGQSGDITFGTEFSHKGRYFAVADNGSCLDTAGYVLIGQLPDNKIEIVKLDTGYCAGNVLEGISLNMYSVDADVHYYIYPSGSFNHVAECNHFVDDSVRFDGSLEQGEYIVKAKVANCEAEIGRFVITEYALPEIVDLLEPVSGCEGTMLDMGVKNSQNGILYEVYLEADHNKSTLKADEYGDGSDLVVFSTDVAGSYNIRAKDTLTGCEQVMDNYTILALPKNFDFVATDTSYCAYDEESGTQLALSGTESGVVYILQQYDEVEAKFVDIQPQVAMTGNGVAATTYFSGMYKAGKYRVRTTTCEGSLVGDELEISEITLPKDSILVDLTGNGCVDSTMNIIVKATENDVKYSLWAGNTQIQSALTGDGTDQQWTIEHAAAGSYEVHAVREGGNSASCAVVLDKKIEVKTVPLMQNLAGTTPICRYTTTTLRIPIVEKDVKYYLYNAENDVKVLDGTANKTNVTFENVNPGTYYAVANNGSCKNVSGVYVIDSLPVPEIKDVLVDYTECTVPKAGQIVINDLQDTLNYILIYPNGKEETYSKTVVSTKSFENLEIGTYYLKVQDKDNNCFSLLDTIQLNHAIPVGDTLIGQFGYCEGTPGATLKLGHSSVNIVYTIMDTSGDTIESIFGGIGQSFLKYYKEGEYLFVAERQNPYGGCQLTKTIKIKKYENPALTETLELQETGALCAGQEYHISVVDAQEDINYILYKGKTPVDTVSGTGKLEFKAISEAGDYTVMPKSGSVCGNKALDTLFHINTLPTAIMVEQPCSYCNPVDATEEVGAGLKIFNTVGKICYVLNDGTNNVDTLYGDYSLAFQEFDKMPAGSYTITATDTLTKCSTVVGSGVIEKNSEPKRFICGLDDQRCAIAAPVGIEDSQEDVEYYLHKNGKKVDGPVAGADGTAISFGEQTEPGIYQIFAKSQLGCSVYMKDSVVIYPPLVKDTLVVKGSYCEGGKSDINFRLRKQSLYWNYFVLRDEDQASTDTLAGEENTVLLWDEVGGKDIRSGKYWLYAMNPCGETQKMDSVVIDVNKMPEKYVIEEGDFKLCTGDSGTITLAGSQLEVEYDLMFQPEDGTERLLLTKTGTGDKLLLAKVDNGGQYTVIGRMKATGCTDTVATVTVSLVDGIQDPGIKAEDVCLSDNPGQQLGVSIRNKQTDVSYYLQYTAGATTSTVDSIRYGKSDHLDKKEFASQGGVGIYQVIAQGPTCKKTFKAAMIGEAASDQGLNPKDVATICGGNAIEIGLKGSEAGVKYEVLKVVQKDPMTLDTASMNIVATGTGAAIKLGELSEAGVYLVKALNGCSVLMKDTLRLDVNEAYKIQLRESYTICGENDSVRIEILGRTNPTLNARYLIYPPGSDSYSEVMSSGNKEESVLSAKWYKEPGFYRVEGKDYTGCKEIDSVEIKVIPMPDVFPISLKGNKYLCDSYSKKDIVVEGAQTGIGYYLYRVGEPKSVTNREAKPGDVEIVFTANQEGTYYVVGQYNDKEGKTCPVKMDGEIELAAAQMKQYAVESIRDAYCENPSVTNRGEVKLTNSDVNVEYQLYQDGIAYGDPQTTSTAGEVLVWKGLSGGVPKMSAETEARPVKYTVKATDMTTGCEVDMNGAVNVIGERTIVFSEKQLQDAIPTCLGSKLNMIVLAYGGKIEYQWMKGADALADGKQYYYTKKSIEADDIGTYSCQMTNTCGTVVTPEVEVVPALLVDRTDTGVDTVVVCNLNPGQSREVQISSRVANADKWVWYKDGILLEGEIYKWLEVAVSAKEGTGTYVSIASNACGAVSDTCLILVDSTPRIELVTPVHKDTLCEGTSWELKVKSTQTVAWMLGTQNTTHTGDILKIDQVKASDEGTYFVVADNRCGVRKEEVGSLVVDSPIEVISTQEQFHICRQGGDLPHLFIQTNPKNRVYYRWEDQKGNVLSTTNELNNIDLKKYTNLVETFRVYYGNRCQDSYKDISLVTSDYIQFKQPVEEIGVCVVDHLPDTVLRVEVMNEQNVTYKWYKLGRNDVTAARDSVGNAGTLVISLDKSKYAGYYYCYIANQCVDTVSRMVNVRIDTIPEILVTLPDKDTLCSGSEMKLKVSARAGQGSLSYVWYVKKKGETPVKVASSLYFGLSQSEYSCYIDDTYDGALVWCDVSTACTKPEVDTLHLTVLPAPKVSMSVLAGLSCEGKNNEIYVKLDKGDQPWKYKYSVDEKENAVARSVAGETDTLKVSEPGIYRVTWLADAKCTLKGKELAVTEYRVLRRSKFTIEAVGYDGPVCPDTELTLRVKITGGVPGPWNVGIYRSADGELASELGFEAPVYTLDSVYTCSFKIQKDEKYFAKVTNVYEKQECEAEALVKSVELKVFEKPTITMNELKPEDRILSACSNVSLGDLFNVQPEAGGWYVVDNQQQSGDWILNPEQTKYTVNYRIYQDGCVFDGYNLGEVELRPKPELSMAINKDVLCGSSENAIVTLNAQGEYPVKVVYRVLNLHKDGKTSLESTPDYSLTAAKPSVDIRFYYDEDLAGKIIEVLRVEDKFKCTTENISMFKDTVLFPGRPVYNVLTKVGEDALWTLTEDETYQIRKGDSVDVKVELKQGDKPWMIIFGEKLFGNSFQVRNIPTAQFDTALYKAGLYEIDVEDKHCPTSLFETRPYITINVIDTAYLNLKAYLQGPWDAAQGKMVSAVLPQIDKHGLAAWPNVGSRKIIDWVEVELWKDNTEEFWDSQRCLLLDDGTIVDTEGNANLKLIGKTSSVKYRVAIRTRNHLAVWSRAVDLSATTAATPCKLDFTKASDLYVETGETVKKYAYMDAVGRMLIYGGDVNSNRLITSFDPNRITREVLSMDELQGNGALILDINYNGKVEWPGYNVKVTGESSAPTEFLDWSIMYKNRLRYSIVPEREINW